MIETYINGLCRMRVGFVIKNFIWLLLGFCVFPTFAVDTPILVVHSYHQEYPWTKSQNDGFTSVLNADNTLYPLYSIEYLDTKRRGFDEAYEETTVQYFASKYDGYHPKLIYVTDDDALHFMLHHKDKLFPGVPLVFSGVNDRLHASVLSNPMATGVFEMKAMLPNLHLIEQLWPKETEVLVVGDDSRSAHSSEQALNEELSAYQGLSVTILNESRLDKLLEKLHHYQGKSIFLLSIGAFHDANGAQVALKQAIDQIQGVGNFYLFTLEDSYLLDGVLGGYVADGVQEGQMAGRIAYRLLKGADPASVMRMHDKAQWVFNEQAVRARDLRLPDSVLQQAQWVNETPSLYRAYETEIKLALTVMLVVLVMSWIWFTVMLYRRKQAVLTAEQRTLKLSERLNQAQQIAHLGNWEWDIESGTLWWSDEIYHIFGLVPQSFTPTYQRFFECIHEDDRDKVSNAVHAALTTQAPYWVSHRIVRADGTIRYVVEQGSLVYNDQHQPIQMLGVVHDVTETHEKESMLVFQSHVVDAIQDSILVHDVQGHFIYLNEVAWRSRGYTKDEMMAMTVKDLDAPPYRQNHEVMMQSAVAYMQAHGWMTFEVEHVCKDGRLLPVEISSRLITMNDVLYILSSVRDISERKAAQATLMASEKKYKNLVEHALVGVYRTHADGTILYANAALIAMFGYQQPEAFVGQNILHYYRDSNQRRVLLDQLQRVGEVNDLEVVFNDRQGQALPVLLSATLDNDVLSGMMVDLRAMKRSQAAVNRLSQVVEQIDDNVVITDQDGVITYVNPAFCQHTGFSREEVLGLTPAISSSGQHDVVFYQAMWQILATGNIFRGTFINKAKDGRIYYENKTITPLKGEHDDIIGFISTGKDVTEEMMLQQQMEVIAATDHLTGVYNRHKFEQLYALEVERAHRGNTPLSLILLDIDHFKQVNDQYGHDVGDQVLKSLAEIVTTHLRKLDILARWGGEEFLVLSSNTDLDGMQVLATKIRQAVEQATFPSVGHITISLGISTQLGEESLSDLFKRADVGLYHAKEHGRNQVGVCVPGSEGGQHEALECFSVTPIPSHDD